jgi:hypothetical protein
LSGAVVPSSEVLVQVAELGARLPEGVLSMALWRFPSVRSAQSFATTVPLTKTYGPVE